MAIKNIEKVMHSGSGASSTKRRSTGKPTIKKKVVTRNGPGTSTPRSGSNSRPAQVKKKRY